MDDTCAVCADILQWVAYGACGHRDVCSTCVARLRFICDDRRCCICKAESASVYVTKALGDYTKMIHDFSLLPAEPKEGRSGSYWYHEDTSAFFDDLDQYKMIKAMCRLSCSICDKAGYEEIPAGGSSAQRRPTKFKNVEQLKGHMFHKHRLVMCTLCLESRKVFICEQKLYTKAQLKQHVISGDSEVDGNESERGGFAGHPVCEFCKTPFYGDNELYTHMSREHYTCHMCQRQHPGHYEYFRNYDDLEMHFRHDHFLCEDETCLAKKFVVFQTESEMKRHNTLEHGGKMSRSKRNAALQIPTSFRYRRSSEQDHRRGRGRLFREDDVDNHLSAALEASLGTTQQESSSTAVSESINTSHVDSLVRPFESLNTAVSEEPRYLHALGHHGSNGRLGESSFPPLPVTAACNQQIQRVPINTMAANLRQKNTRKSKPIQHSSQAWPSNAGTSSSSLSYSDSEASTAAYPDLSTAVQQRKNVKVSTITHSASAPNLTIENENLPAVEDVQTANRSLVDKLRHAMQFDEAKFASFKEISAQYRQGQLSTSVYLDYVDEYGLMDLVLELARLCPDPRKQNELVDSYLARCESKRKQKLGSDKGKKKTAEISSRDSIADNVMNAVRSLQAERARREDDVEILSKDGYRSSKAGQPEAGSSSSGRGNGGEGKSKKKTSKFHRMRLGDGSMAALLDSRNSDAGDDVLNSNNLSNSDGNGAPVRGVWRKGGVQKLFL